MKKILFSILFCFTFIGTAQAVPLHFNDYFGSFEAGPTGGWTIYGDVSFTSNYEATDGTTTNFTTMTPTDGYLFALLKAADPVSMLISPNLEVQVGDAVSFDWFFSAEDYLPYDDFASFSLDLILDGGTIVADVLSSVAEVGDWGLTGWSTVSIISPVAGSVFLNFYSVNVQDPVLGSALGIDNVRVSTAAASVPVPATMALLLLGLVSLTSRLKVLQLKT